MKACSPKSKVSDAGLYLTATDAFELKNTTGNKSLFIDLRTHGEIYALGMAKGVDANVQYESLSDEWSDEKGNFKRKANPAFLGDMDALVKEARLNKNSTIILMCRSGKRSAKAASLMHKAGYMNVYTVIDGYEGDKSKTAATKGQRNVNGWKNAGLPWSYKVSKDVVIR